jgi:hypothetical protein
MTKWTLAALVACLCGIQADAPRELDAAYHTPEATIASYWHRMAERRHAAALECFFGRATPDGAPMLGLPELVELRCRDFRIAWRGRGIADVEYEIEYRITLSDSLARFSTGDRMRFTAAGWRIERPLLLASNRR